MLVDKTKKRNKKTQICSFQFFYEPQKEKKISTTFQYFFHKQKKNEHMYLWRFF